MQELIWNAICWEDCLKKASHLRAYFLTGSRICAPIYNVILKQQLEFFFVLNVFFKTYSN